MQVRASFLFLFLANMAAASPSCPVLLTTSFALSGPLIAGLRHPGQLTVLQDRFIAGPPITPDFRLSTSVLPLPFHAPAKKLSSVPDSGTSGGFFATVSTEGALSLVLPDGRAVEALMPGNAKVTATALFRSPAAETEKLLMPTHRGLRTGVGPGGTQDPLGSYYALTVGASQTVRRAERQAPIRLFIASGETIYRLTLRYADVSGADEDLRNRVRVKMLLARVDGDDEYDDWNESREAFADLGRLTSKLRLLIPTAQEGEVLELSGLTPVYKFTDDTVMAGVDFLHAISHNELVAGSELGQVVVVDLAREEVSHNVKFPGFAWLKSLTAHAVDGSLKIWAVNAVDSKVYRWSSKDLAALFRAESSFPQSVVPEQIATFGNAVPLSYSPGNRGYLSNYFAGTQGGEMEEILVLGSDGKLYAQRDRTDAITLHPEREWVAVPFLN